MDRKPRYKIIYSAFRYNILYGFHPVNDPAQKRGTFCMYVDGIIRKPGYLVTQGKWIENENNK